MYRLKKIRVGGATTNSLETYVTMTSLGVMGIPFAPVVGDYQQRFTMADIGKVENMPTNANTGVLTRNRADYPDYNMWNTASITLTAANTPAPNPLNGYRIIQGYTIYGRILRGVSNVWIRNCILRGPSARPSNSSGIIQLYDTTYDNWLISECHFLPQFPVANMDAIIGNNFTMFNCNARFFVDGTGVFSGSTGNPSTKATNTHIYGNLFEQAVYFNGPYYASWSNGDSLLRQDLSGYSTSGPWYARPLTPGLQDLGHEDGNHCDPGTEIQGGYGNNSRPQGGDFQMNGNGIHVKGNFIRCDDAEYNTTDLTGLGFAVPGQAGSLANSSLGTQDGPPRLSQHPNITAPVNNGKRLPDGRYAVNGQAFVIAPNVNLPPWVDNNNFCMVIEENWVDDYKTGLTTHDFGKGTLGMAFLNNRFTGNAWPWGNIGTTNPQVTPIRPGSRSHVFATAKDGTPGLQSNIWLDDRWAPAGSSLKEGRTAGIQYIGTSYPA